MEHAKGLLITAFHANHMMVVVVNSNLGIALSYREVKGHALPKISINLEIPVSGVTQVAAPARGQTAKACHAMTVIRAHVVTRVVVANAGAIPLLVTHCVSTVTATAAV